MSTKIQASSKSSKKSATAAPAAKAKAGKPAAPAAKTAAAGKGAVVSKPAALAAAKKGEEEVASELPTGIDPDEAEEQEDAARASAGSGDGNAAALAAAAGGATEMSASFKNFRHHPDMENFYRFIYENDLRHEALQIMDQIQVDKQQRRQMKSMKANAH